MRRVFTIIALAALTGCPKPQEAEQVEAKKEAEGAAEPATAMGTIQHVRDEIERNCGKDLKEVKASDLEGLEIAEADQAKADELLQELGLMAQQCGDAETLQSPSPDTCNPDCSWCPIKWYWCIENAGACAGGDNKSCCKLGACGSKHHCEDVCKSSCGCDVPPLPADGGGGDEE